MDDRKVIEAGNGVHVRIGDLPRWYVAGSIVRKSFSEDRRADTPAEEDCQDVALYVSRGKIR